MRHSQANLFWLVQCGVLQPCTTVARSGRCYHDHRGVKVLYLGETLGNEGYWSEGVAVIWPCIHSKSVQSACLVVRSAGEVVVGAAAEANRSIVGQKLSCHNIPTTSGWSPKSHTLILCFGRKSACSLYSLGNQLATIQPFLFSTSCQRLRAEAQRILERVPPCLFTNATATSESMYSCTTSPSLISSCRDNLAASSSFKFMCHGSCRVVHSP